VANETRIVTSKQLSRTGKERREAVPNLLEKVT
jgi:hypothetical protein